MLDIEGTLGAMVPTDEGILGALEALLDSHSSPDIADLPPLHGGIVGYLDMTSSARSSTFLMLLPTITACLTQ